jgi:hypothetical protein
MIINLFDWDLTYDELVNWVAENNIVLDAINGYGGGASTKYIFQDEEDFVAFRLKFAKDNRFGKMGFNGITTADVGYCYAPYIPIQNEKSNN